MNSKIKKILLATCCLIAIFVICITLPHSILWLTRLNAEPFNQLHQNLETTISDVGGCVVLSSEADVILRRAREIYGKNPAPPVSEAFLIKNAPAIYRVLKNLHTGSTPRASFWIINESYPVSIYATTQDGVKSVSHRLTIPAHVVIRFGTHTSYAWLLIFATDKTLTELPDGVIHIGETVYLSQKNL